MAQTVKKYQKKSPYSYTFGAFPTFELLSFRPEWAKAVYVHSEMDNRETEQKLRALCEAAHVRYVQSDQTVERLREKEKTLIIGMFEKQEGMLHQGENHVVLVNPSDMGNLGTILRTCLGSGIHDIAIVEPAADVFNPKVVRASMGSMFRQRVQHFSSFEEYEQGFGKDRTLYPFVLRGKEVLQERQESGQGRFALIFGNEATGLPAEFEQMEHSITIRQNPEVDSFNLSIAVGMAVYEFTKSEFAKSVEK